MRMVPLLGRLSLVMAAALLPTPAWAEAWVGWFQWGTQGSYVHQFSHLLFTLAMLFFLREIYWGEYRVQPGFNYLWWACWILVFWNVDAIIGHAVEWSLHNPVILGEGLSRRLLMEDLHTWMFYFFKINHFLWLIPAFYLVYRGMKTFALKAGEAERES
ncbi:MAG: hypothetical protein K6T55_03235 [Syntrophobacterales bacterium]|nr:hypothetical protein [Syntrophobacterales bacterium]